MATAPAGVAAVLSPLCGRDFLSSADYSANETAALLDLAAQLKSGDRRIDMVIVHIFCGPTMVKNPLFWI